MSAKQESEESGKGLAALPKHVMDQFASMAMMLPETESDGGASIITAILSSKDVHELDATWGTKDPDKLVGDNLTILGATRSLSDFKDGLGVFLVVEAVLERTGETVTFTTGSMGIVAQIVRAAALDAFPLRAMIQRADKPTADGYYPQHLKILDQAAPVGR